VTLPCKEDGDKDDVHVMWVKDDRSQRFRSWVIQTDGSLSLPAVARDDSGTYMCVVETPDLQDEDEIISGHALAQDEEAIMSKYNLVVRSKHFESLTLFADTTDFVLRRFPGCSQA